MKTNKKTTNPKPGASVRMQHVPLDDNQLRLISETLYQYGRKIQGNWNYVGRAPNLDHLINHLNGYIDKPYETER